MPKDKNRPKLPLLLKQSVSIISLGIKNNWAKNRLSTFRGFLHAKCQCPKFLHADGWKSQYSRPTMNHILRMHAEEDRSYLIMYGSIPEAYLGCDILALLKMGETRCAERQWVLLSSAHRSQRLHRGVHFHLLELTCKCRPINHIKDSPEHVLFK